MLITIINSTDGRKVGCTIGQLTENDRQILRKTFSTIELQFTEYDLDGGDIQIVTAGEIQDKLYSSSKYQLITTLKTILKMEGG